jgi:hypothetical protein
MMQFTRAKRQQAYLRLGLSGSAGSGKTYSSLLIARGLLGPTGKIALIDTEAGSASLYSNVTEFDVLALGAPYEPRRYVEAIKAAESSGYGAVVVDSLSHAWAGEGGCLDLQGAIADSGKGNSYTAWRKVTPEHNRLVDALLGAKLHVLVTMRTKTEYALEDDGKGKKVPKKIGMAPVQRDGLEYEFTVVFDLDQAHNATVSKDRTQMFDGVVRRLGEDTGRKLAEWLAGAEAVTTTSAPAASVPPMSHVSQPALVIPPQSVDHDELAATLRHQWSQCVAHYGTAAEAKAQLRAAVGEKPFSQYTAEDAAKLADLITSWKKEQA